MNLRYPLPCKFICPTMELANKALKVLENEGILWANGDKPTTLPNPRQIYSLHLDERGNLLWSHSIEGWNYGGDNVTIISINTVLRQSAKATLSNAMLDLF